MTERFREVEPLGPGPRRWQVAATDTYAYVYGTFLTVPEARALRDWLNAALPEELDARDAEIERLRQALRKIMSGDPDPETAVQNWMRDVAARALEAK